MIPFQTLELLDHIEPRVSFKVAYSYRASTCGGPIGDYYGKWSQDSITLLQCLFLLHI